MNYLFLYKLCIIFIFIIIIIVIVTVVIFLLDKNVCIYIYISSFELRELRIPTILQKNENFNFLSQNHRYLKIFIKLKKNEFSVIVLLNNYDQNF